MYEIFVEYIRERNAFIRKEIGQNKALLAASDLMSVSFKKR